MKIAIIGATNHGKSTLCEAIKNTTGIQYEVLKTQDLIELVKNNKEILEDFNEKFILENQYLKNNNYRKKGKEIKSWQRTKFYQK